ncbi:MAG: Gldg family protein [Bdellovibrionales bacterium]|nr:Gldg family protein [Bdellovibrionales bacterium]
MSTESETKKSDSKWRAISFGTHSLMTTLIVASIIGVINFLGYKNPKKIDLTKNKLHTLSDQTRKIVAELKTPVKFNYFDKLDRSEQSRILLDNYRQINPQKIEIEMIDPNRDPFRAKQAEIRTMGTLQIISGTRENLVTETSEEKITNALIKLSKDSSPELCVVTGHGEKSFTATDSEGFGSVRKGLLNQSYQVREINLVTEGKIPSTCTAVAVWGGKTAWFPQEVAFLKAYLDDGGRALIAVDVDLSGKEPLAELIQALEGWFIRPSRSMMIDPVSRVAGLDPTIILLPTLTKDSPITKGFELSVAMPFARPIETLSGAPAGLNIQWIARSTPKSWGELNFADISRGKVQLDPNEKQGPLDAIVTVEGKQPNSKASKNTRIALFGSSLLANNNFSRFAGNTDLFLNAASWIMEDESLISIRPKEEGVGKIEITDRQNILILLVSAVLTPLIIASGGVAFWFYRKRL